MTKTTRFRVSLGVYLLALLPIVAQANTTDVSSYYVSKTDTYTQTALATAPLTNANISFQLQSLTATSVSNPTVTPPTGGTLSLVYQGSNSWFVQANFLTIAARDSTYAVGANVWSIKTNNGTALTYTPTLTDAGNYPTPNPDTMTNNTWTAQGNLAFNYLTSNTLTWGASTDNGGIQIDMYGSLGDQVHQSAANGATSFIFTAGTFVPNESYDAFVSFKNSVTDSATLPGVNGFVENFDQIYFKLVPEPSTWAMMIVGSLVGGLSLWRRRRLS